MRILIPILASAFCLGVILFLHWWNFRFHERKWRVVRDNGRFYVERCDAWIWFRAGGCYDAGFETLEAAIKDCFEMKEQYEQMNERLNLPKHIYKL